MFPHKHDLLGGMAEPKSHRNARHVLAWTAAALGVLVVAALLLMVVPSVGAVRVIYANADAGRDDLNRAKDAAETLDFDAARAALSDAALHFGAAEEAVGRLGLAARLPWFSDDVESVRAVLEGGRETSVALKEALDIGADLFAVFRSAAESAQALPEITGEERGAASLSREERRAILQKLVEAPGRLGLAREALERAISAFDRVTPTPFTRGLIAQIEPQKARLIELRGLLSQDLSLLSKIPEMIGYPEPKTYLFLLLNNTELRPGGGFIGTYGEVAVSDGAVETFRTADVYALDGPSEAWLKEPPPEPIRRWLTPYWFMRDANWSPDFVASAADVENFYRLERGPVERFDGVIGITPTLISRLLEITGPIEIDGSRFDAANLTEELEYQVELGFADSGIPYPQRKDIVGKLGQELIERLMHLPVSSYPMLAALAADAIEERHFMITFRDPELQAFADRRDWSARFPTSSGDLVSIVDANLGALKTDAVMERSVAYGLRPEGDSWVARAAITYRHTGTFNWKTTRYRTYTRFYAPPGSEFLRGEGMMVDDKLNDPRRRTGTIDVGTELGKAVFGGFIAIEPGETRTLAVEWRVSEAVARQIRQGSYDLFVRKQLGTLDHALTLDLDFGKKVSRAESPEAVSEWGDDRYRITTDLTVDRNFTVEF